MGSYRQTEKEFDIIFHKIGDPDPEAKISPKTNNEGTPVIAIPKLELEDTTQFMI